MLLPTKLTLRRVVTTSRRIATSRPQLPPAQTLNVGDNYALKYIDIRPTVNGDANEKKPTFVLLHGAPGSFQDFKYLIPLLQDKARVIGINLPGNGESQVIDQSNYYDSIHALKVHRSAYDALVQLCGDDEDVFVLGHSFGGHATINLTAFNQDERKLNIRGMALVASAGLRPHRAMQPRTNAIMAKLLRSKVSLIEHGARELVRLIYVNVVGFPDNAATEHFVAGIVRAATTDFIVIKQHVERIRDVPAFFAWAKDDAFIEEEIITELSQQCHPGPRLAFDKGGHNIQKSQSPLLAEELLQWTRAVINGTSSGVHASARDSAQHPLQFERSFVTVAARDDVADGRQSNPKMLPRSLARRSLLATPRRFGGCNAWVSAVATTSSSTTTTTTTTGAAASPSPHDLRTLSTAAKPRRPALPAPQTIAVGGRYSIKYIDVKPPVSAAANAATPTIVLIHGAPGSYQDFKYLIPLLQDKARVVAINLPGNGDSTVLDETGNYYQHIRAANLGHSARDALLQICGRDDNVFVAGHSFGGHAAINVAALNEMEQNADRKLRIRGVALLASAGLRIHKGIEKSRLDVIYRLLDSEFAPVEAVGRVATQVLYRRVWKFPSSMSNEHYVAGLVRCASTDFALVGDHAARIAHVPAFVAWAKDEPYIQNEIFRELSDACSPGPRIVFEKGGHNIQKTKAEFLAKQLLEWTQCIVNGDTVNATREIIEQP